MSWPRDRLLGQTFKGEEWKGLVAKVKLPCLEEVDNWVSPSSGVSQREISGGLKRDLKHSSILLG